MQKNAQQKIHPPSGGGPKMYLIWESPPPAGGDYRKIPPTGGDLPPPILVDRWVQEQKLTKNCRWVGLSVKFW